MSARLVACVLMLGVVAGLGLLGKVRAASQAHDHLPAGTYAVR